MESLTIRWKCIKGVYPYYMSELLTVIGLVLVLEGLPYFAFPDKFKAWLLKVVEMPEGQLRICGLVSMLIGLLLVFVARRSPWLSG